jgi:hypothetical protein
MPQENISRHLYRMRVSYFWVINLFSLAALTAIVCFLTFVGITVKNNGTDGLNREVAYQSTVISLLLIITYSVVFAVFSNYLLTQ